MISKKSRGPLLGLIYAAIFGTFATIGIHDYFPEMKLLCRNFCILVERTIESEIQSLALVSKLLHAGFK